MRAHQYEQQHRKWCIPKLLNPSCLQATMASWASQESSHTVPHVPLLQISTRPSKDVFPLDSLIPSPTQPVNSQINMHFTEYNYWSLKLTFCTSKSSIIQMSSAEIRISNPIVLAVHKSWFSTITDQVIQEDGTSSLTKVRIVEWRSSCGIIIMYSS